MNAQIKSRGRLARVRKLQHGLAAVRAHQAAQQVEQLEVSRERLASLRAELSAEEGITDGAALSRRGELAMRLDAAHEGMVPAIMRARSMAEAEELARLAARIREESASKLHSAARKNAQVAIDNRPARSWRPVPRLKLDEA